MDANRFIELHRASKPVLINARAIAFVATEGEPSETVIYFSEAEDDYIIVDESYEEVRARVLMHY